MEVVSVIETEGVEVSVPCMSTMPIKKERKIRSIFKVWLRKGFSGSDGATLRNLRGSYWYYY